jgi:hypothetical protein
MDLQYIIIESTRSLAQLSEFVDQFALLVEANSLRIITDNYGNMALDAPADMPKDYSAFLSRRLGVIDRLIATKGESIYDLLQKGAKLEARIRASNPEYESQITENMDKLIELNRKYTEAD